MPDSPHKLQWHPAFYAAAGLELQANHQEIQMIPEYNLSKEPIRIDLLIIKNTGQAKKIENEIGHIMKKYNVIEYKSPEDSMTIDDFYKTVGYACLYKGYGKTVNEIPLSELTVSLFREAYPRELFAMLEDAGHHIEEKYPGIYYVTNNLPFPAQIIVTKQLSPESHSSLRILSEHAEKDDIERFLQFAQQYTSPEDRNNIDAVLQVSVTANYDLYQEVRRESIMCQALQELMKDEIQEQVDKKIDETKNQLFLDNVRSIMESLNFSAEQAMDVLQIPQNRRAFILSNL